MIFILATKGEGTSSGEDGCSFGLAKVKIYTKEGAAFVSRVARSVHHHRHHCADVGSLVVCQQVRGKINHGCC